MKKTSDKFDIIKTKELNDIDKSLKEIKENIVEINNNKNKEDINNLFEDYKFSWFNLEKKSYIE